MTILTYISIFIFIILLLYMSNKYGVLSSISLLAKYNWILLMITLCSQCLLIYPMLLLTPTTILFLPFLGCFGILLTGITNIFKNEDSIVHYIAAIISFICFSIWVFIINVKCLLPLIVCLAAGKENIKWRIEIGLIISVYITLLLLI